MSTDTAEDLHHSTEQTLGDAVSLKSTLDSEGNKDVLQEDGKSSKEKIANSSSQEFKRNPPVITTPKWLETCRTATEIAQSRSNKQRTIQQRKYNTSAKNETKKEEFSLSKSISSCDGDETDSVSRRRGDGISAFFQTVRQIDRSRFEADVGLTKVRIADIDQTTSDVHEAEGDKDKKSLDQAQKNLINQLKKQVNLITKHNKMLEAERDDLEQKLLSERRENDDKIERVRNQLNERNLKLAVLEEHFTTINNDKSQAALYASPEDGQVSTDGESVSSSLPKSIAYVDKKYLNDLESSLQSTKSKLKKIEKEHALVLETFTAEKEYFGMYIDDLSEKLQAREDTITILEQSLTQLRESRFGKMKGKQRSPTSLNSSQTQKDKFTMENGGKETGLISPSNSQHGPIDNKVVNKAVEETEKEYKNKIQDLTNQLQRKDEIIAKLEKQAMVASNNGNINPADYQQHQQMKTKNSAIVRNISITNEMMNTSIQRLENLIESINLAMKDENVNQAYDETTQINRIATKMRLLYDELKVSIHLVEYMTKNKIDTLNTQQPGETTSTNTKVSGEDSSEGNATDTTTTTTTITTTNTLDTTSSKSESDIMQVLRESESSLLDALETIRNDLRNAELALEKKQDVIEALENACIEHVHTNRNLQGELEMMKERLSEFVQLKGNQLQEDQVETYIVKEG